MLLWDKLKSLFCGYCCDKISENVMKREIFTLVYGLNVQSNLEWKTQWYDHDKADHIQWTLVKQGEMNSPVIFHSLSLSLSLGPQTMGWFIFRAGLSTSVKLLRKYFQVNLNHMNLTRIIMMHHLSLALSIFKSHSWRRRWNFKVLIILLPRILGLEVHTAMPRSD